MKIIISYNNGLIEEYTSSEESTLSSDAFAAGGVVGAHTKSAWVLMRPRFDLFETEGLRIDMWWYSVIKDSGTRETVLDDDDIAPGMKIANLNLEPGRILHILTKEQMADVATIEVDGKWFIRRYDDVLVNETKFSAALRYWFGSSLEGYSIPEQAVRLQEVIQLRHPDWDSNRVAQEYGYPYQVYEDMKADFSTVATYLGDDRIAQLAAEISNQLKANPDLSLSEIDAIYNSAEAVYTWDELSEAFEHAAELRGKADAEEPEIFRKVKWMEFSVDEDDNFVVEDFED